MLDEIQRTEQLIQRRLVVALAQNVENMAGLCDLCPLCPAAERGERIALRLPCLQRRHFGYSREHILILMRQQGLGRHRAQEGQARQVVPCRFRHKNILLDHGRYLIPLALIAMVERARIANPVVEHDEENKHRRLNAQLGGIRQPELRPRHGRQPQKAAQQTIAHRRKRHIAQQEQQPVVLVEKDIQQIPFIRFLPQEQRVVVDIVKMIIEDHAPEKRRIEHERIRQPDAQAHGIPHGKIPGQERRRSRDQEHRAEIDIGVVEHPPPKTIAETMVPFPPRTERRFLWAIDLDKNQPEHGAQNRRHKSQFQVLLHPGKENRKQRLSSSRWLSIPRLNTHAYTQARTRCRCNRGCASSCRSTNGGRCTQGSRRRARPHGK